MIDASAATYRDIGGELGAQRSTQGTDMPAEDARVRSLALGYVRTSTQGQFDEGHHARQIEKILERAKRRGLAIARVYEEVVHGALTLREDRPALHECLDDALARGCQIICTSPSRLTRNSAHARHLYDQHPDRFDFVEPLNGYADRSWYLEVEDCHASFPGLTSTGTINAMDRCKTAGKKLGAGDGGVAGRAAAREVNKANKQARVERMAAILAGHPSWQTLTRAEAGKLFGDAGIHPPHSSGSSPVPWTNDTITRPFREAKKLLASLNPAMQTMPRHSPANTAALPSGSAPRPILPPERTLQQTSAVADRDPEPLPVDCAQSTEPVASSHGVAVDQVGAESQASSPDERDFQDDGGGDEREEDELTDIEVEPWTNNPLWGRF